MRSPARAVAVLAFVALATLAAGPGCGGDDAPEGPPASFFGVNGQLLRSLAAEGRIDELDRHLDAISGGGLSFVRAPLDWRALEPAPPSGGRHAYDWRALDAWIGALARHGLRWNAVGLGYPIPDWAADKRALAAGCGVRSPPADAEDFATMMGALARRYGTGGKFWRQHLELSQRPVTSYEIWNEENTAGFWCPQPDPPAYASLFLAAAAEIHAAEPGAEVVLGGLASFREDEWAADALRHQDAEAFLTAAVAAEPRLPEAADAVAVHSYGPTPEDVLADVAWFRAALTSAGMEGTPMSLNEVGWTTQGSGGFPAVSDDERAAYLVEVTRLLADGRCGVVELAPHTWISNEIDPAYFEDWF